MIDSVTGERVQVHLDPVQGPFVYVVGAEDCKRLEYLLDAEYFVPYLKVKSPDLSLPVAWIYSFGSIADPRKLQALLDGI